MAIFGAPAHQAAAANLGGMMLVGAAGVGLINALGDAAAAARDARYQRAYGDALSAATAHADEMEDLARVAVGMVAQLEVEVAQLRLACAQRQEVIDYISGRA